MSGSRAAPGAGGDAGPVGERAGSRDDDRPRADAAGGGGAARAARRELLADPAARTWIERFARRRCGIADGERLGLSAPDLGHRTAIVFVERASGERVVVRLLPTLAMLYRAASAARYLHAQGLPVPRPLGLSLTGRLGPARGYALLEEFVRGIPFNHVPERERAGALRHVADALAAFHSHARGRPGWIGWARRGAYVDHYLPHVLARVSRLRGAVDERRLAELRRALLARAAELRGDGPWQLLHGHVYRNNFLVHDGGCWVVDVAGAHYGDAARDLVRALGRLCRGGEGEVLLSRYFERVSGYTRDDWERQRPFYTADHELAQAAGCVRRRGRADHEEPADRDGEEPEDGAARAARTTRDDAALPEHLAAVEQALAS